MNRDTLCFDRARFERVVDSIENMAVGELWQEIPLSPERDELDALAHGVNVLSSELRYRLRELQGAQASLIHSGKLAALGEVSSGLAHELNNPLTIVTDECLPDRLEKADVAKIIRTAAGAEPVLTRLVVEFLRRSQGA